MVLSACHSIPVRPAARQSQQSSAQHVGKAGVLRINWYEPNERPTMMYKSFALLLLVVPLATPALADGSRMLAALDADKDGAISRAEILVLREQVFARVDADASGTVTMAEIKAAQAAMAERRKRAGVDNIWSSDADGNGELTLDEFTAKTPGFDRADRDGDGVLSGAELDRVARLLGSFPADGE